MAEQDHISGSPELNEAMREALKGASVTRRRGGVVLFEANDNQRGGARHGAARRAVGQDVKGLAVLREIAQRLRRLLKLEGHARHVGGDLGELGPAQVQLVRLGGIGG